MALNILETAAHTQSAYLHPGGERMTRVLIEKFELQPGQLALEIGCGTGATALQVAETTRARVIAFDQLCPMLASAQIRLRQWGVPHSVSLLAANADESFPFPNAVFEVVYAESVLALTHVSSVLRETARVLRPGGKLIFNERIWKPNVSEEDATRINRMSLAYFGIPAATSRPWNKKDWIALLNEAGFIDVETSLVDNFLSTNHRHRLHLHQRITHFRQHLTHPATYIQNLRFRFFGKRFEKTWENLEAILFIGRLADG